MERTEKTELFERTPILKAVTELALPTVVGQIILVIYNMADTFFIGLTERDAMIAAVTVCMPAFMFLSAISNLFGIGGSSVISRALGARDRERARLASSFAFWGCLLTAGLYALGAWLLLDPFVDLLGGWAAEVHFFARQYLVVTVVLGGAGTAMSTFFSHLLRSEGHSLQASIGIAMGGVLNIGLDPLFMFVILKPGQEILGAAIATALSNLCALAYFVITVLRGKKRGSVLFFRPDRASLRGGIPQDIFATGLPACVMTLFENISYAVLDNLMSIHGIAVQAGIGVAKKVNMLAHCIVRGVSQGVLPLLGYNFAARNYKRMRAALKTSMMVSIVMASLCMVVSLLFAVPLVDVFLPAGPSREYGARFLRILCLGGPFSACAYALISFFQAVGKGVRSFVLAILRKGLVDIPLMFLLRTVLPIYGIVWATPAADSLCCATSLVLFTAFLKRELSEGKGREPLGRIAGA